MAMGTCRHESFVDAHFAGDQSPNDERAMRAHLPGCAACTARYQRQLLLARLDPRALSSEERLGRGLGVTRRRLLGLPALGGTLGFAVAAAVLLLWARGGDQEAGFTPRGAPTASEAGLRVFRLGAGGAPARVEPEGTIAAADELAFAYSNPRGRRRLMVFAVDEQRRVYWYHPAWERETDNPVAVTIEAGAAWRELPAAVRHPLAGAELRVHALFTDEALDVRAVEARLRDAPDAVPCAGCERTSVRLRVARDPSARDAAAR
jgi:hypothetical protein